jgi:hypothetical protein
MQGNLKMKLEIKENLINNILSHVCSVLQMLYITYGDRPRPTNRRPHARSIEARAPARGGARMLPG